MYYKKCIIKGKWQFMTLLPEEEAQVIADHRKLSNDIMEECLIDSLNRPILKKEPQNGGEHIERIAIALFEARCPKLFTMIQNALDSKIKKIEDEDNNKT